MSSRWQRRVLFHLGELDVRDDPPPPPPIIPVAPDWTDGLIMCFAIVQMIIASAILLAYIFNKNFRIHPGNISVGFAASALGLSVVWLLNLRDDLVHDHVSCAWLGFFSQLAEYCSSFYEIGTLYYFYCYFREIAKPVRREIHAEGEDEQPGEAFIDFVEVKNNPQGTSVQLSQRQSGSLLSQTQSELLSELTKDTNPLNQEGNLSNDEETRELRKQLSKIVKVLNQMKDISNKTQETVSQLSARSNQILLHMGASSYAALQVQTRIHIFVVIAAFAFVLIPSLTEDLGIDFYNVCSIKWVPEKQGTGIIITIIVTGLSAIISLVILAYFWAKKITHKRLRQEYERIRETGNLNKLSVREQHYVKHLLLYVFCSTSFGFGLAATNVYADYQVDYNSKMIDFCFIMHYLIIAIRGILLLWLKLAEPETRKALFDTFKNLFNRCKQCFGIAGQHSLASDDYELANDP